MAQLKKILLLLLLTSGINLMASEDYMLYLKADKINSITDFSFLPPSISVSMLKQLPDTIHTKSVGSYNVFELNSSIYAIGDGFFDVLQWNDTAWINLYTSPYLGYNFLRKIFTYKGEIYAIGGYGYWHAHSNLLKFDPTLGYWTMMITVNKPDNYYSPCVGKIGDTIISVFGKFVDESINLSENAQQGYILNLDKMVWHDIKQDIPSIYDKDTYYRCFYDLDDYSVIELSLTTEHGFYVLDKSTLEIFFYKRDAIDVLESPFVFVVGNSLSFANNNSGLITINFSSLNYDAIPPMGRFIDNGISSNKIIWVIILTLIIAIIVIATIKQRQIRVKKIIGNHDKFNSQLSAITNNILKHNEEELSIEEINNLFGIDSLGYEVRRHRRSKMIIEINMKYEALHGHKLLTRIRDNKDKRHFQYKIHKHEK